MPPGRAVTDTSPLLNLAFTDRLHLLDQQFSTVLVPDAVLDEIREGEEGAEVVLDLVDTGLLATVEVARDDLFEELAREIDHGEAAVIRHAIDAGIDRVIIDEREGRAAARRHDLHPTGVVGI
ncbi:MAG: DUF3368 domain-containing protein, partial [Candidatus Nanohaloarchaea archaeon]|nr:DUF3368 domain-containing protein [Candidatus Nanohaloarchaea archaeon]